MPLVAILVGCKGKAACKADVDELVTFFHAMDHSMPLYFDDELKLVERPDLPKKTPHRATVVTIGKTLRMNELEVTLDSVGERLAAAREKVMQTKRKDVDPNEITLVIDASTHWDEVAQIASAAAGAGYTRAEIAFGVPVTTKPPPRVDVDDKLDAIKKSSDASNKAVEIANLMSKIVKNCKALQKSFGRVSGVEGEDKAQVLIDEMGPALLECNCDVDIPALRNVFFAVANNPHPATVIHVDLAKGGKAISLPAATPWSEAQNQLADGAVVTLQVLHD